MSPQDRSPAAPKTTGTPPGSTSIAESLLAFVAEKLGNESSPVVTNIERISTGRSRENWLFDLGWSDSGSPVTESLIVRRDPEGGLLETERATEFEVLAALADSDLPSPPVRWLDADGSKLGKPSLIMTRLPGSCDYYVINGERTLTERLDLARRFCELLAAVHEVDWQTLGIDAILAHPGPDPAQHELDHWTTILGKDQLEPWPELVVAERWLRQHAPTASSIALVHGDFKPGNILLDEDDQITALLDWELVHLGDPHEDLGWITQPLRTGEHLIAGNWETEDLLTHYEACSGRSVDRSAVQWWNTFAAYKTAVMQVSGLRSFVEGRIDVAYEPSGAVLRQLLDAALGDTNGHAGSTQPLIDAQPGPVALRPTVVERLDGVQRLLTLVGEDRGLSAESAALVADARKQLARLGPSIDARSAFLRWDNAVLGQLLAEHDSPPPVAGSDPDEPDEVNFVLRAQLVDLLRRQPKEGPDVYRATTHLRHRLQANPALSKTPMIPQDPLSSVLAPGRAAITPLPGARSGGSCAEGSP